jgi:hypothetical protein
MAYSLRSKRANDVKYQRKRRVTAKAMGLARKSAHESLAPITAVAARSRFGARCHLPALDGPVIVTSDAHYWRGAPSLAHRAAVHLAKELRAWAVINNGDSLDGSSISRYEPSSYLNVRNRLSVEEELAVNVAHLSDFEKMDFVRFRTWNMGNHDARFETLLATKVPQYAGVHGFHLKDHFPSWLPAWATWIGDDVIVKHRMKGGTYAAANNTVSAGRSIVTGHDHQLWVKAFTDYNGTRFGIDAGTLQDVWGEPFLDYTEDNAVNWQSGFAILHFEGGRFTGPELVYAMPDGRVLFRGTDISKRIGK